MPFLVNVDDHRVLQQPTDAPVSTIGESITSSLTHYVIYLA